MKHVLLTLILGLSLPAFSADFTNESEAGLAVANGNTKSQSYNIKQTNTYTFDLNLFKFEGRYLNAYADKKESARFISGSLRYERSLNDRLSIYVAQGLESDKFAGYRLRHYSDLGLKYNIYKEDTFYWLAEAGYRYTNEKDNNDSYSSFNSLRLYTEAQKNWNPNVSTKLYVEYLPNLEESKDWQMNTELSLSAALTNIFSIKTAALVRYDNTPAVTSTTKTDTLLTTALVAKF